MKKIITTLTAVTFALGLAGAAQAQVAKTPEKPAVQTTQDVKTQVAPKEAVKPGDPLSKEAVTTIDKTKEAVKSGDKGKQEAKKATKKPKKEGKQEIKPVAPQGQVEKKAGAPVATTPEGAK